MLTTPDNLVFLHLLSDDIQNELFHHLPGMVVRLTGL